MISSPAQFRTIILTGSIALIVASGAWYGAGLKMKQEAEKEVATFTQAKPVDRVAMLEAARSNLVSKKMGLEQKIEELERRSASRDNGGGGLGRERR